MSRKMPTNARVTTKFDTKPFELLKATAISEKISVPEVTRRIIDDHFNSAKKESERSKSQIDELANNFISIDRRISEIQSGISHANTSEFGDINLRLTKSEEKTVNGLDHIEQIIEDSINKTVNRLDRIEKRMEQLESGICLYTNKLEAMIEKLISQTSRNTPAIETNETSIEKLFEETDELDKYIKIPDLSDENMEDVFEIEPEVEVAPEIKYEPERIIEFTPEVKIQQIQPPMVEKKPEIQIKQDVQRLKPKEDILTKSGLTRKDEMFCFEAAHLWYPKYRFAVDIKDEKQIEVVKKNLI